MQMQPFICQQRDWRIEALGLPIYQTLEHFKSETRGIGFIKYKMTKHFLLFLLKRTAVVFSASGPVCVVCLGWAVTPEPIH